MTTVLMICGTDTGVGKTHVTARVAKVFAERGARVCVLKLVQTGNECDDDARTVADASGVDVRTVVSLPFPASPHLSAKKAGVRIDAKKIVCAVHEACAAYEVVLVEGSGGLLVPLDTKRTLLDVAQGLGIAVVLVAANRLGVVNHTLLSLSELARRGMRCAGVVFNATDPKLPAEIAVDNPRIVKAHSGVTVFGPLPFTKKKQMSDAERRIVTGIVKKVQGYGLERA